MDRAIKQTKNWKRITNPRHGSQAGQPSLAKQFQANLNAGFRLPLQSHVLWPFTIYADAAGIAFQTPLTNASNAGH
jgi:hypothetical protein